MAGLEPGDLEARRAVRLEPGVERSGAPGMLGGGLALKARRHVFANVSPSQSYHGFLPPRLQRSSVLFKMILGLAAQAIVLVRLRRWLSWRPGLDLAIWKPEGQ